MNLTFAKEYELKIFERSEKKYCGFHTTFKKQIQFLDIKSKHIEILEKLSTPYIKNDPHKDQFDRTIISQGIAEELTVISADSVFPLYKDKGFKLLEN